jgi:chromate reductase
MPDAIELIGISGSLRAASACTAVLHSLADRLPADVRLTIVPIGDLPVYNDDDERPAVLAAVERLKQTIERADGLIVISPEYNHGMSGVLKNAVDWVSRPGYASVLRNKPVMVMSASNSPLGGSRAQAQLRETFASTLSRVVARRQICIGMAPKKITDGRLNDEPTYAFILDAIGDLVDEVMLWRHHKEIEPRGSLLRPVKPQDAKD